MSQLIVVLEVVRGLTATSNIVKEKLHWSTMTQISRLSFRAASSAPSRQVVPRLLALSASRSMLSACLNSCIFDFLYVGESRTSHEYILILKDDFSGYAFLRPCKNADAETSANVLNEYFTTFIPVLQWFSDQCPHFCNKVMQTLASSLRVKHRFSTVCAPWSNGTVESVCKRCFA